MKLVEINAINLLTFTKFIIMKNLDIGLTSLTKKEMAQTNGGLIILAVVGLTLAWAGIGATICWAMAEDNRDC